jgi:hypothetical protein
VERNGRGRKEGRFPALTSACMGVDYAYIQPYVEQAATDKTRAEKEKASYDVCFFNLFSCV